MREYYTVDVREPGGSWKRFRYDTLDEAVTARDAARVFGFEATDPARVRSYRAVSA